VGKIAGKNMNAKDAKTSPSLPVGQASRLSHLSIKLVVSK